MSILRGISPINIPLAVFLLVSCQNSIASSVATVTPIPPTTSAALPTPSVPAIHMAYFSKAGCPVCAKVNGYLEQVQGLYPQLTITEFPIEEEESKVLSEWLGWRYGVPEEKRLTTPMVFVGEDYLVGRDQVVMENLQVVLNKYVGSGAEATWRDFDAEQSGASILERFRSFGMLTVVGAGLVDGLNPCAFATIVFFISYLAFLGRKGREILAVGGAFALGVFLTYLLVGMGLLKVLEELPFLTTLSRWVYGLTALFCLALAAIPYLDRSQQDVGRWFAGPRGKRIALFTALGTLLIVPALVALDSLVGVRSVWPGVPPLVAGVVIPLGTILALLALLYFVLRRVKASTREVMIAYFTVLVVSLVVLTLIMLFFRGPGMHLYWPWAMPAGH